MSKSLSVLLLAIANQIYMGFSFLGEMEKLDCIENLVSEYLSCFSYLFCHQITPINGLAQNM